MRCVLFLQGPCTPLWRELAHGFEQSGARVRKIHVSPADAAFWLPRVGSFYLGRFAGWRAFLARRLAAWGVTDIVAYADRQPYHVVAQELAAASGVRFWVVENGYLRPDWLTLERDGMSAYSRLPDDPQTIRARAEGLEMPDLEVRYRHDMATEMACELLYHGMNTVLRPLAPFFRSGRAVNALFEHAVGTPHAWRRDRLEREAVATTEALWASGAPYVVMPLQLQTDQAILANSPFAHLSQAIERTIASFARCASADMRLVFKQHPHDNDWENWPKRVADAARGVGVSDRVLFLDGGDLEGLLRRARGCVTVNSTSGLQALRLLCPTAVLGVAVYDMPGLTHGGGMAGRSDTPVVERTQDVDGRADPRVKPGDCHDGGDEDGDGEDGTDAKLDRFWVDPDPVDAGLLDAFLRVLAHEAQVKGSFYDPAGRAAAVAEIVRRVLAAPPDGAEPRPAPRLRRLKPNFAAAT